MATLSTQTDLGYDDDELASGAAAIPKELTWNWRTWPSNLRRAGIVSASAIVAMILLVLVLQDQDKSFTQKLDANTGSKAQAQTKLRESGQERDTIVKHLPVLKELEARNIFGEEKRLEWVEQLRIIEKRWPGVEIKYNISPQKLIPKEGTNGVLPPIPTGAKLPNGDPVKHFGVFNTEMKLSFTLLHEGDALAIFDELKAANLGLFAVKKCTMKRPNNKVMSDTSKESGAPLNVECTLSWVSMNAFLP
jgi:hypothetical protein